MPLGGFGILSLFYIVIGIRFVWSFWPRRSEVFDDNVTAQNRTDLAQLAFFVLVPVSVLLHELGHAISIWSMGGSVTGFGFYFFAGYVSYDPTDFSAVQRTNVASAGSFVNLLLILLALAVVFLKHPPLRAASNELLLQFVLISGLNAFLLYPILDVATGMNGDWTQIYRGGVPWLIGIIVTVQLTVITVGAWAMRNEAIRARIGGLTGHPAGSGRAFWNLGGGRASSGNAPTTASAKTLLSAGKRVASGWPQPVQVGVYPAAEGDRLMLAWESSDVPRAIQVVSTGGGQTTLSGAILPGTNGQSGPATAHTVRRWESLPSETELVVAIREAMEQLDQVPSVAVR